MASVTPVTIVRMPQAGWRVTTGTTSDQVGSARVSTGSSLGDALGGTESDPDGAADGTAATSGAGASHGLTTATTRAATTSTTPTATGSSRRRRGPSLTGRNSAGPSAVLEGHSLAAPARPTHNE